MRTIKQNKTSLVVNSLSAGACLITAISSNPWIMLIFGILCIVNLVIVSEAYKRIPEVEKDK